jgi:hypothetical protein
LELLGSSYGVETVWRVNAAGILGGQPALAASRKHTLILMTRTTAETL